MSLPRPHRFTRLLSALCLLAVSATYVAVQVDFFRRHRPGIAPARYWTPQLLQVWLPGIVIAGILGLAAFVLHRRGRPD